MNAVPSQASDFEFFKSRTYNEGMPHVRVFAASKEQALEWLMEPPPAKTGALLLPP